MTTQAIGSTSQQRLVPYLNPDMIRYHRRRGVRYEDLVPQGSPADQTAALAELLESASARADTIMLQVLAATMDTVLDTVNINRQGYAVVHPRYRPIIGVTSVALGASPDNLATLASLSGVAVKPSSFSAPVGPVIPSGSSQGPIQFGTVRAPMGQAWILYTICTGYPVTEMTAAAIQGATSITVADTTGIVQGQTWLTIYAGKNRFRFLAGAVSTAPAAGQLGTGPGTVACAALPYAIPDNALTAPMVSAAPSDVIEAVAYLARGIAKSAGGGNVSATTTSGNRRVQDPYNAGDDFAMAEKMLAPYSVPVV